MDCSNMKQRLISLYYKIMLWERSSIVSINNQLKDAALLMHSCHRSVPNFIITLLAAIYAYYLFSTKLEVNFG